MFSLHVTFYQYKISYEYKAEYDWPIDSFANLTFDHTNRLVQTGRPLPGHLPADIQIVQLFK